MKESVVLVNGYGHILCELEEAGNGFYAMPAMYRDAFCGMLAVNDTWTVERITVDC